MRGSDVRIAQRFDWSEIELIEELINLIDIQYDRKDVPYAKLQW